MSNYFVLLFLTTAVVFGKAALQVSVSKTVGSAGQTRGVIPIPTCNDKVGEAKILETRISNCTSRPCTVTPTTRIDVDFEPVSDSPSPIGYTFTIATPQEVVFVEIRTIDISLVRGERHNFNFTDFAGGYLDNLTEFEMKFEVYSSTHVLQFCFNDTYKRIFEDTTDDEDEGTDKDNGVAIVAISATTLLASLMAIRLF